MSKTFLFAFCIAATLAAQDFPTFRVETRLVEVDIVVHRKGEPVADLTAADFTLFDRGKKQKIALFSVRRDSEVQAAPPLAPGVVTNRVTPLTDGAETPTPTVILLDTLNSLPADMAEVRPATPALPRSRSEERAIRALFSKQNAQSPARLHRRPRPPARNRQPLDRLRIARHDDR